MNSTYYIQKYYRVFGFLFKAGKRKCFTLGEACAYVTKQLGSSTTARHLNGTLHSAARPATLKAGKYKRFRITLK